MLPPPDLWARARFPAGEESSPGQGSKDLTVAAVNVINHYKVACGGEILGIYIVFFRFQSCMGDAMPADDFIPLLVNGGDSCRDARHIFSIRHDSIIVYIQGYFLQIQLLFVSPTENGRKNTAAKQLSSMAASCGYHILRKLLKNGAPNQETHAPIFIRAHIQLAGHDLTNNHTFKLLSGLLMQTLYT